MINTYIDLHPGFYVRQSQNIFDSIPSLYMGFLTHLPHIQCISDTIVVF